MRLRPARPPAEIPPPLLCRWDLDKTYLRSEFDTLGQLWRTARERGEDKVEVPGVADLMKALKAVADARGRALSVHFISASPPQIGKAIRDKLAFDGVPYDGITFKNQLEHLKRGRLRNLREHVGYKLTELLRGRLAAAPGTRELLFGDDWESDALTYSLYADVVAGHLPSARLRPLLARIGVDREQIPDVLGLAGLAGGLDAVDRILINLERRTPPSAFRLFGPRVVPTFNYFQTAVVLAADGTLDAHGVARVARALIDRSGYTPRRLENSLADLVRRGVTAADVATDLAEPLRRDELLPSTAPARRSWMLRVREALRRRRAKPAATRSVSPPRGPLDYDTILDRLRPARGAVPQEASPR